MFQAFDGFGVDGDFSMGEAASRAVNFPVFPRLFVKRRGCSDK
ncbi:MAG: hypothetical protein ACR2HG_00535 [Pyrinomonadaceae bacterium]